MTARKYDHKTKNALIELLNAGEDTQKLLDHTIDEQRAQQKQLRRFSDLQAEFIVFAKNTAHHLMYEERGGREAGTACVSSRWVGYNHVD